MQWRSSQSLDIPVKYIGVGESIEDLQKFDADEFVNALFDMTTRMNTDELKGGEKMLTLERFEEAVRDCKKGNTWRQS